MALLVWMDVEEHYSTHREVEFVSTRGVSMERPLSEEVGDGAYAVVTCDDLVVAVAVEEVGIHGSVQEEAEAAVQSENWLYEGMTAHNGHEDQDILNNNRNVRDDLGVIRDDHTRNCYSAEVRNGCCSHMDGDAGSLVEEVHHKGGCDCEVEASHGSGLGEESQVVLVLVMVDAGAGTVAQGVEKEEGSLATGGVNLVVSVVAGSTKGGVKLFLLSPWWISRRSQSKMALERRTKNNRQVKLLEILPRQVFHA